MYACVINDKGHKYTCESADKSRVISFMEWFLDGVQGQAEVSVFYRQNDAVEPPVKP